MVVTLTKLEVKPHVLRCVRDDGSATWFQASASNAEFFAAHDLSHFAIETVLGYRTAFYGLVAAGRDLDDFGSQGGVADTRKYSDEAIHAEEAANLMLLAVREDYDFDGFWEILTMAHDSAVSPLPSVSREQFDAIKAKLSELLEAWRALAIGESLSLEF